MTVTEPEKRRAAHSAAGVRAATGQPPAGRFATWTGPWRKPRVLAGVAGLYLIWSLAPVVIAVLFSFNAGKSRTSWQGFSLRWYTGVDGTGVLHTPSLSTAVEQTLRLGLLTTVIAVPLGVAFALGLDRWRGRLPAVFNGWMLLSFVVPEIVLGIALLFLVTQTSVALSPGTTAQVVGLVTYQISYPVVICRARLATIGGQYEEAARDLGASALGALRRVLMPMLRPAILASAVLVFADVIDDFVIVRYLSSDASTEPTSVKIYNSARASQTPALNALASLMLAASMLAVLIGWLAYRRMTRGEPSGEATVSLGGFAGQV